MSGFGDLKNKSKYQKRLDELIYVERKSIDENTITTGTMKVSSTSEHASLPGKEININNSMKDLYGFTTIAFDDAMDNVRSSPFVMSVDKSPACHISAAPTTATSIDPMPDKVDEIERKIIDMQAKIDFLDDELIVKDAKINALESLIAMLEPRVTMLELTKKDI